MDVKNANFWWLKNKSTPNETEQPKSVYMSGEYNLSTNSLVDIFEKEAEKGEQNDDVDVGSIIEEINRVAAQSPLGPYDTKSGERSVDELMKEAEKIYIESSKSFEQLSQRSKTSQNISEISLNSRDSTPTPKSISPLPLDPQTNNERKISENDDSEFYSDDFSEASKNDITESTPSIENNELSSFIKVKQNHYSTDINIQKEIIPQQIDQINPSRKLVQSKSETQFDNTNEYVLKEELEFEKKRREIEMKQMILKNDLIKALEIDNEKLKRDIEAVKVQLEETQRNLQESRVASKVRTPDVNNELEKALDELKDSKEINTALQLQLDTLTNNNVHLKNAQEDLFNHNKNLERRLAEIDTTISKYKHELLNVQRHRDKLLEVEISLNKLLDVEKIQTKSLKIQHETDAKCIQDLNRQIKEMERIIARKHPDSVSALIMAAKCDPTDTNLTARKILEDRIKTLEEELVTKEKQSTQVFTDIQEKFNQMKSKYEHHIEDLELHVSDLKNQLKKKIDCYDMYTQTIIQYQQDVPEKESTSIAIQTDVIPIKPPKVIAVKTNPKINETKSESHLLATIRGLQSDLSTKEKVLLKMQRELDELKKTNKRLQKEREGSLKNLNEKKENKSNQEKIIIQKSPTISTMDISLKDDNDYERPEFEKIKKQLYKIEMDYDNLKKKRLHDLNVLQEAHEREIAQYIQNLQPLREQLELQQLSINTLQSQLVKTKEELAIATVERDHLNDQLSNIDNGLYCTARNIISDSNIESLQKKLAASEKRYEEREQRLRAIVNGLAQKSVMNRNCEQCAERRAQLISYKNELDSIMASIRVFKIKDT